MLKYKGSLFLVDTMDIPNRVVLSNIFVDDYDRATDSTLSHAAAIKKKYVGDYTGLSVATASRLHYDVVRTQLTQNLGMFIAMQVVVLLVSRRECTDKV